MAPELSVLSLLAALCAVLAALCTVLAALSTRRAGARVARYRRFVVSTTLSRQWSETGRLSCLLHYLDSGLKPAVCRVYYIILTVVWNRPFVVSTTTLTMVWNRRFAMTVILPWKWSETGGLSWKLFYLENGLKPAVSHDSYFTLKWSETGGLSCKLFYLGNSLKPAVSHGSYFTLK